MRIAVIDIETNGLSNEPDNFRIGVINDLRNKKINTYLNHSEFVKKIKNMRDYIFYCHTFDISVIFGDYIKFFNTGHNYLFSEDGTKFYFGIYDKRDKTDNPNGRNIKFVNIFNLMPTTVDDMGKILHLPKGITPQKAIDGTWDKNDITKEDIEYCHRDTEIVKEFLIRLIEVCKKYGVRLKYTLPSIALKIFDKIHNKMVYNKYTKTWSGIYYDYTEDNDSYYFNREFKESYFGGISQNYIRGRYTGEIFKYDINSLYPYAMRTNKYGVGKPYSIKKPTIKHIDTYDYGLFKGKIEVYENDINYIPYRLDKFLFPYGTLKGSWNLNEIKYNLKKGRIKILEIDELIVFDKTEYIFKEFIDDMYGQRISGTDDFNTWFFKKIMNLTYGKYATQISEKEIMDIDEIKNLDSDLYDIEILDNNDSDYIRVSLKGAKNSFVLHAVTHLSSNITSESRIIMYELFDKYKDIIIYTDTDSLFTTEPLPGFEIHKTELGKLKFEGSFKYGYIFNPKHYYLSKGDKLDVIKIKGVRNAKDIVDIKDPLNMSFPQERHISLLQSYRMKGVKWYEKQDYIKEYNIYSDSKRIFNNSIPFDKQYSRSKPIFIQN